MQLATAVPVTASYAEGVEALDALRADWDRLYGVSRAPMTASWAYMRGWAETTEERWLVAVARARDSDEPLAVLPLVAGAARTRPRLVRQLWSRAGVLCAPEHQAAALPALADLVQRELTWDHLGVFQNLDPALDAFVAAFDPDAFEVRDLDPTPHFTLALPESWDAYLRDSIGRGNRRRYRLAFRAIEESDRHRITVAEADTLERHIAAFLEVHESRWGPTSDARLRELRQILERSAASAELLLLVCWDGARPIAAIATLLNHGTRTAYFWLTAYDDDYAQLGPGRAVFGDSVRLLIERGFATFELMAHDYGYKQHLGGVERLARNTLITRRGAVTRARLAAAALAQRAR